MKRATKIIAISFTLKDQNFAKIEKQLKQIAKNEGDVELVHAFMPREVVKTKKFSTDVVDALDKHFPNQTNFFDETDGVPLRNQMVKYVKDNGGKAIIIGDVKHGVEVEKDLYELVLGVNNVHVVSLDEKIEKEEEEELESPVVKNQAPDVAPAEEVVVEKTIATRVADAVTAVKDKVTGTKKEKVATDKKAKTNKK